MIKVSSVEGSSQPEGTGLTMALMNRHVGHSN
jgi:hypothetical protein